MPFGDRTGPLGQDPRTGRSAGFCRGFAAPGSMNPAPGQGFGGRGGGRGWRNWFHSTGLTGWQRAAADGPLEIQALKSQAGSLASALEAIRKRLDELEAKPKAE